MTTRFIQGLDNVDDALRGGVVTIGNFDGVHRGHQLILQTARALGDAGGVPVVAVTFDPPPDVVLRRDDALRRLTPHHVKCELLGGCGADAVVTAQPAAELLEMRADEFVTQVVVAMFAPAHVVEGQNFRFGRDRAGGAELLARAGRRHGFDVQVVEPVMAEIDGRPVRISSTRIRGLIAAGRIAQANRCLGRSFALYGRVMPGSGHGRLLQFPTANIAPVEQVVPPDGVYAGAAEVAGDRFAAAVSIGHKPTLGPSRQRHVEAFLIDAEGDYYDQELSLELFARLRDQRRFDSTEELSAQIARDVDRVRQRYEQRV
ncbi:MAG: bifunctional riboflavin kinase/FAD synthetase [Planctomycetota bacterium]